MIPILYAQITEDEKLPQIEDEIIKLKYIQTANWEGGKVYLLAMISTSKKVIPIKQLKYIGNIKHLPSTNNEFIPADKISIPVYRWKNIEKGLIET